MQHVQCTTLFCIAISQMTDSINCHSKVVSRHHVLSYISLTLNVRHIWSNMEIACLRAKEIGWAVFKPPYTYHIWPNKRRGCFKH